MKAPAFFKSTKYLWIGGIMGVLQQLAGRLDYHLYHGRDIFSFSAVMGSLSLYAAIILLTIKREMPPKQQLRDLFLFFLGLDFFYYLYIFICDLIGYFSVRISTPEQLRDTAYYFQRTHGEIIDFFKWTVIGTAAAVWAFFATRLRNRQKRKAYIAMLLPLFGVMVLELLISSRALVMYLIQEYKRAHNLPLPQNTAWCCTAAEFLTALVCLCVCLYQFVCKGRNHEKHKDGVSG